MPAEIFQGDCLKVAETLDSESVDLVYVDPPFFSQKVHSLLARDRTTRFEFSDRWASRSVYLDFLRTRIREFRRVLKKSGSLFFHCDTNASHHVRLLLEDIFGEAMFRSEIIWYYRRWSNSQRSPLPSHQTLFFFSKTKKYKYNQLYEDYSPSTNIDQILQLRQRDEHGKSVYARQDDGRIAYHGHKQGVPIPDVWDIPLLNPKACERVGYPTQKPILLLERIISLVTSPNDIVLDPFCGSGTTLVAAELLGRNSIGIDVSEGAAHLSRGRVAARVRTCSELLHKGRGAYAQSDEEALAYLHGLPIVPVQRNRGIDAILKVPHGEKPVLLRVQRRGESLAVASELLHKAGRTKKPATLVLVALDSTTNDLFDASYPDVLVVRSTACELNGQLARKGIVSCQTADNPPWDARPKHPLGMSHLF